MKKLILSLCIFLILISVQAQQNKGVSFSSSNKQLSESFAWAKEKALSFAHDGSDPVGYWYEAALPNREAFCMRDVSHQSIGAEILGLSKHNQNMYLKFAQNISKEKDYCSWWEINRYNKPAPVDYESDKDFWYNLPANFDIIYNANRLYNWTANKEYINNADLNNFYKLSLNEYVDHWDLGQTEVAKRDRTMHLQKPAKGEKWRFGNKRGIPTYNEGGRGETLLGIDMTASLVAAYNAYFEILMIQGKSNEANKFRTLAKREQQFLNDFWWDSQKGKYRSILYADNYFDHFMVGKDQAFLHYILYYNAISDPAKIKTLVDDYVANYNKLIVELKSYLPIIFYENGRSDIANKMLVELCSSKNKRRDYPENSYTVIEHFTRGLMGIEADAATNSITTLSRMETQKDWGEISNVPILGTSISVKHNGNTKSTFTNHGTSHVTWDARIQGKHTHLFVNGKKQKASLSEDGTSSFTSVKVNSKEEVIVSTGK